MADEVPASTPGKKEAEVLSDVSLLLLGRGIGQMDLKGIELAMYLNIPTTTIIKCIGEVTDVPLTNEGTEIDREAIGAKCVILWKEMTKNAKTRDRVKALDRALREIGKSDIADLFMERHQNNQELTNEIFGY